VVRTTRGVSARSRWRNHALRRSDSPRRRAMSRVDCRRKQGPGVNHQGSRSTPPSGLQCTRVMVGDSASRRRSSASCEVGARMPGRCLADASDLHPFDDDDRGHGESFDSGRTRTGALSSSSKPRATRVESSVKRAGHVPRQAAPHFVRRRPAKPWMLPLTTPCSDQVVLRKHDFAGAYKACAPASR